MDYRSSMEAVAFVWHYVANIHGRLSSGEGCHLASSSKDTTVKVWDIIQRRPIFTMSGHTAAVTCIRWSGKNWIYSGSQDKSIRIWDGKDVFHTKSTLTSRVNYCIYCLPMHIGSIQCPYRLILSSVQERSIIRGKSLQLLRSEQKKHWIGIVRQGELQAVMPNDLYPAAMISPCSFGSLKNQPNPSQD